MNRVRSLASLIALLAVLAALAACATGTTLDGVTNDVSLNEADAALDGSATRLPARGDASTTGEPDAESTADAAVIPDASFDADAADAADAATVPDGSATGACGPGFVQVGEYATWYGKVNVHRASGGSWLVDSDCSSGADVNTVSYCQKLWPATTKQAQLAAVSSDAKPFTSGGGVSPACGGIALSVGQNQFACCAP